MRQRAPIGMTSKWTHFEGVGSVVCSRYKIKNISQILLIYIIYIYILESQDEPWSLR